MMRIVGRGRSIRRQLLGAAIAGVIVLAGAGPATAAPAPTSWTVGPASKAITYGQGVILNGTLVSGDVALGGLWTGFFQSTEEGGTYDLLYMLTTSQSAYYTGTYTAQVKPSRTMYYQFRWEGDEMYAASDSAPIAVTVKPALGAPTCRSSAVKGKKLTVKGSVKPGAPDGPVVKIKSYRKRGDGTWVGYKTYATKVTGTQYSQTVKITRTGKFKFRAVTAADDAFVAAQSGYSRVLTVTN